LEGIASKGISDGVIDIYSVITDPYDLVYKIEPSEVGSEKISSAIFHSVSKDKLQN
jgi:hypothetical protein